MSMTYADDDFFAKAKGQWRGILLGLDFDPKALSKRNVPCPACGGTDRFRFTDNGGDGQVICSHCAPTGMTAFNFLRHLRGWDAKTTFTECKRVMGVAQPEPMKDGPSPEELRHERRMMWRAAQPVTKGDPVDLYLSARGLGRAAYSSAIRYHPNLPYTQHKAFPAMLAALQAPDLEDGTAGLTVALHRTWLTPQGGKADVEKPRKLTPGSLPPGREDKAPHGAGCAIRLTPVAEHMGISEGVETAMAAAYRFGVPTWAAFSATLLQWWEPPAGVKRVTVFGDNDLSFTGHAVSYALARRLRVKGLEVDVQIPDVTGFDWADVELNDQLGRGAA